jgi:hypothetical protein
MAHQMSAYSHNVRIKIQVRTRTRIRKTQQNHLLQHRHHHLHLCLLHDVHVLETQIHIGFHTDVHIQTRTVVQQRYCLQKVKLSEHAIPSPSGAAGLRLHPELGVYTLAFYSAGVKESSGELLIW